MSITPAAPAVVLEPAAKDVAEATSTPPFLYELTPDEARAVLDDEWLAAGLRPRLRSPSP